MHPVEKRPQLRRAMPSMRRMPMGAPDQSAESATASAPVPRAIGRAEKWSLRLVYGGPVSLWVPLARVVGVRVMAPEVVDDELLVEAEAGAVLAARRFGPGLFAATAGTAGVLAWMPRQLELMDPVMHQGFHSIAGTVLIGGGPLWLAMFVAGATLLAIATLAGALNALVFGGIPLVLLRRCTVAAAPAVSVALSQGDAAIDGVQAEEYPRVAFAAKHILYPRGRR
jgi:hypothetical protein